MPACPNWSYPCTLVLIAQHLVRLGRLLELLLGLFVPRVLIGVILKGLLPVGLFYLLGRGASLPHRAHRNNLFSSPSYFPHDYFRVTDDLVIQRVPLLDTVYHLPPFCSSSSTGVVVTASKRSASKRLSHRLNLVHPMLFQEINKFRVDQLDAFQRRPPYPLPVAWTPGHVQNHPRGRRCQLNTRSPPFFINSAFLFSRWRFLKLSYSACRRR